MILDQLLINGVIAGVIYALMAASFSLVYNVIKFMDLSPGAIFVVGAFGVYTFGVLLKLHPIISVILSILCSILVMLLVNQFIYKPLRKRNSSTFILLLSSFGVFLLITGLILLFYGAETKVLNNNIEKGIELLGFIITRTQIALIIISFILFFALYFFTKKTRIGKAMRAMADDKVAASTLGIDTENTISITFILSAILASSAGILVAYEQNLSHTMGFAVIIKGLTSSIIGGVGNIPASMLGGLLIGLIENLGVWYLPSGYKDAIVFVILIIFLLIRPRGILGEKTREEVSG